MAKSESGATLSTIAVSQIRDWVLQGMLATKVCPSQEPKAVIPYVGYALAFTFAHFLWCSYHDYLKANI